MKEQIVTKKHSLPEKQFEQMFDGSPFTDAQKLYAYRDLKNCLDTAYKQGVEEGKAQAIEERQKNKQENKDSIYKILKDGIATKQIAT